MKEQTVYQIRDTQGDVLAEFDSLLHARVASVDMTESMQIVERSFVDDEWEDIILYERTKVQNASEDITESSNSPSAGECPGRRRR